MFSNQSTLHATKLAGNPETLELLKITSEPYNLDSFLKACIWDECMQFSVKFNYSEAFPIFEYLVFETKKLMLISVVDAHACASVTAHVYA